ncbi:hypothetical protein D3C73_1159820 [compost metagenome]
MLAGGNRNFLPLLELLVQAFTVQFNAAALRKKWRNEAYTQFNRFLDSKFHFFTARHHLPKMNMQGRFAIVEFGAQYLHIHAFLAGVGDLGVKHLVAAVK